MARYLAAVFFLISTVGVAAQEPDRATIDQFVLAIQLSNATRVEQMIEEGFPVNITLPVDGAPTPLHIAAAYPNSEIPRLLMEAGADLLAFDDSSSTPFMVAIRSRRWETADSMIEEHGYDVDSRVGGLLGTELEDAATPLTYAAMHGEHQIVGYLLSKGADPELATELLLRAVRDRQFAVVEGFASTEVGLNHTVRKYNGSTALHIANENGDAEMVRFLLDHGADMMVRNGGGFTAFEVAVAIGLYDVARIYLDEYDYNIDELGPFSRSFLFYPTVMAEDLVAVQFLLENGADPNLWQHDGSTYLHVHFGQKRRTGEPVNHELIKLYLDFGFDPNKPDIAGYTLAHTIAMQPDPSVFDLLDGFELELDVTEEILGATPLGFALQSGNLETARRLLEMGADPNIPYSDGRTILSLAVEANEEDVVRLLVSFGVSLTAQGPDGSAALDYASESFREKIADLLR